MKASSLKKAIVSMYASRQPAFIWGPPGVGKSDIVRQAAKSLGIDIIDIRVVLLDVVDLRGFPQVKDGATEWAPPVFLPTDGKGFLFLDEMNAARPEVLAGCYQLILDRAIGEYRLPDGWTVIAAGNREGDRSVASRLPTALANRMLHLALDVDLQEWSSWALGNGVPAELIAFLRFRPSLLHAFDPKSASPAFPSPRSWASVGRLMMSEAYQDMDIFTDMASGLVGDGASAELLGFLQVYRQLPSLEIIRMAPDTAPVPDGPAATYAVCAMVAQAAAKAGSNSGWMIRYVSRLSVEFAVMAIKDAATKNPNMMQGPEFIKWAADHHDVLF